MTTPVDLSWIGAPLARFLDSSCLAFAEDESGVAVSTIALVVDPYARSLFLSFDTPENSVAHVKEWEHKGPAWYGQDGAGKFNNNPEDFAHSTAYEFEMDGFPVLDDVDDLLIRTVDNVEIATNRDADGDESVNKALFVALAPCVRGWKPPPAFPQVAPFRVGLVFHDSECVEFWLK